MIRYIPKAKRAVPRSSITPTLKYVAAGVPPSVTKVEPAMSIIDPRKNSRKPRVATVSFTFHSPER